MGSPIVLAPVGEISTPRQANIALEDVHRAEDLLRKLDELDDMLRDLITYEIQVYKAIIDSGLESEIKKKSDRYAVYEFSKLDDKGVAEAVKNCIQRGVTLRHYFEDNRYVDRHNRAVDDIIERQDAAVKRYEDSGETWLPETPCRMQSVKRVEEAVRNRTKDVLLKRGAVGVGDGRYVNPKLFPNEAKKALIIRAKSIGNDIRSAIELYAALKEEPDYEFKRDLDVLIYDGFSKRADLERRLVASA